MSKVDMDSKYIGQVSGFSGSGNPVIDSKEIDKKIVVFADDEEINKGDTVECVIQKELGDHYQALRSSDSPIMKPERSGQANIPIHHDGKHGESVGDTRKKHHSMKPLEERQFNPKTHGAPPISRDEEDTPQVSEESTTPDTKSLEKIAKDVYSDKNSN
jgi:hypothetical protein